MNIKGVRCNPRRNNYRERAVGELGNGDWRFTVFTIVPRSFWDASYRARAVRRRRRGNRVSCAEIG